MPFLPIYTVFVPNEIYSLVRDAVPAQFKTALPYNYNGPKVVIAT